MRRRLVMARIAVVVVAAGALGLGTTRVLAHADKPEIHHFTAAANTTGTGVNFAWTETGLTPDNTSGGKVTYVGSVTLKWTFSCPDENGDMEKAVRSEHISTPFTSNAMANGTITESLSDVTAKPPLMPNGCTLKSVTVKDIAVTDLTNGVSEKTDPVTLTF
jgi:hypothetical protein